MADIPGIDPKRVTALRLYRQLTGEPNASDAELVAILTLRDADTQRHHPDLFAQAPDDTLLLVTNLYTLAFCYPHASEAEADWVLGRAAEVIAARPVKQEVEEADPG
jgi:hypothetical protein